VEPVPPLGPPPPPGGQDGKFHQHTSRVSSNAKMREIKPRLKNYELLPATGDPFYSRTVGFFEGGKAQV